MRGATGSAKCHMVNISAAILPVGRPYGGLLCPPDNLLTRTDHIATSRCSVSTKTSRRGAIIVNTDAEYHARMHRAQLTVFEGLEYKRKAPSSNFKRRFFKALKIVQSGPTLLLVCR